MKIETRTTAYRFATAESLKKFLALNEGRIQHTKAMVSIRDSYKRCCFVFIATIDGKYDWDAYETTDYAKEAMGVKIIIFGHQRTE